MQAITKNNFKSNVLESKKTILLDVWAPWCAPCRAIAPILQEISDEYKDIEVVKLDASVEMELAQEMGITSLPTLMVIKNGKVVNQLVGMTNKKKIVELFI